jgi:hypothetical protein
LHPLAALLSYLVPGLGQIVQGRIGKGVLFLVCIYTLFFYGMYLGSGTIEIRHGDQVETYRMTGNVYLPDTYDERNNPGNWSRLVVNLYNRPQFLGQVWIGIAAWPAIWQYATVDRNREETQKPDRLFGTYMRAPTEEELNLFHNSGDKRLELAWVYTVIAGVLNIMVIYDALAGAAFVDPPPEAEPAT